MSTQIEQLRAAGYALEYNARGWSVHLGGKKIGGGGREEFGRESPFDTSNWIGKHRQCAIWVAERHLARQNSERVAREDLAANVPARGEEQGGRHAGS